MRLDWSPILHWWVLTEPARWPDGMLARNAWLPTTNLVRGIEPFEWSHRRALLFIGVIEEGIKCPLSLFQILEALRRWKKGLSERDAHESIDRLEQREEDAARAAKKAEHRESRARAADVIASLTRTSFSRFGVQTAWTHAKALDAEFKRRTLEQYGANAEAADAEVAQRMKEGGGISAIRRDRKAEVAA